MGQLGGALGAYPSSIAIIASSLGGGGAEKILLALASRWVDNGHKVTIVLTFNRSMESLRYRIPSNVKIIVLSRPGLFAGTPKLVALGLQLFRLLAELKRLRPDFVVSFLTRQNLAAILVGRLLSLRVIASERTFPGLAPTTWMENKARRVLYPFAERVIVQTRESAEWMAANIPSTECISIPNPCVWPVKDQGIGVAPQDFLKSGDRMLLAVGRLASEKRFDFLIESFATISSRQPNWRLLIVGDGPQAETLRAKIASFGLEERIKLVGWVGNMHDWYLRADAFAATSAFEGFPNAILESMSYGIATIASNCKTGPSELIDDGVNGILVEANATIHEFSSQLLRLLENPRLREDLGGKATAVREIFNLEKVGTLWDQAVLRN